MSRKENYTYPVVLQYGENGMIDVAFPNFPNLFTCVENNNNYIEEIQDCLALEIDDRESIGAEIPEPLKESEITLEENQKLIFVNIWMPYQRSKIKITYTKKTLTIPTWLDILAKEKNINFSSALVKSIKRELGIEEN